MFLLLPVLQSASDTEIHPDGGEMHEGLEAELAWQGIKINAGISLTLFRLTKYRGVLTSTSALV